MSTRVNVLITQNRHQLNAIHQYVPPLADAKSVKIPPIVLPIDGYSRLAQLLPFLPFGKTTVWKWVKEGKFPSPVKLSTRITVWRNADIHAWLESLDNQLAA